MNRSDEKLYGLISLAMKAGGIAAGSFAAEQAVKGGQAFLLILAKDASDNTKKKFNNSCAYYHVPLIEFGEKEKLGHSIGKEERSALAVTNESLAGAMRKNKQGGR